MSKTVLPMLALAMVLAMACFPNYPEDMNVPEEPWRLVGAVQEKWDENPIRFIEQHQGDVVDVKGMVKAISVDAYITIQNGSPTTSKAVVCAMDLPDAVGISKFDTVRVSGRILRFEYGSYTLPDVDRNLILSDCQMLEHEPYRK